MSNNRKFKTGLYTTSTGIEMPIREVTGATIAKLGSDEQLNTMAAYLADCLQNGTEEERLATAMALPPYDFYRCLVEIILLSYGPTLDEAEIICPPAKGSNGHPAPVKFKPLIDLSTLVPTPPILKNIEVKHGWGTCKIRPMTWQLLCDAPDDTSTQMTFLQRVESIDGEPFAGVGSLSGPEFKAVNKQILGLDGDAGLDVIMLCPTCGRVFEANILTDQTLALDFFGML